MNIELTKDAKDMLSVLYQEYKRRIKEGVPKQRAKDFSNAEKIQSDCLPTWSIDDILSTSLELQQAGLGKHYVRSGIVLNDAAVVYMESRFKTGALEIVDIASKLIP